MSETGQPGAATPGEHGDGTGQQDDLAHSLSGWAPPGAGWRDAADASGLREPAAPWRRPEPTSGWGASSPRHGDLPAPFSGPPADSEPATPRNGHPLNGVGHGEESPLHRATPVSAPPVDAPRFGREPHRDADADRLVVPAPRPAPTAEQQPPTPGQQREPDAARHLSDEPPGPRVSRWSEAGFPSSAPPAVQVPPVGTAPSGFEVPPGFHAPQPDPEPAPAADPPPWADRFPAGPPAGGEPEWRPVEPTEWADDFSAGPRRRTAEPATEPRPADEPDWSGPNWNRPSWGGSWAPSWSREEDQPFGRRARADRAAEWAAEPSRPYEPVRSEQARPYQPVRAEPARPYEPVRSESPRPYEVARSEPERPATPGPAARPEPATPDHPADPPAASDRSATSDRPTDPPAASDRPVERPAAADPPAVADRPVAAERSVVPDRPTVRDWSAVPDQAVVSDRTVVRDWSAHPDQPAASERPVASDQSIVSEGPVGSEGPAGSARPVPNWSAVPSRPAVDRPVVERPAAWGGVRAVTAPTSAPPATVGEPAGASPTVARDERPFRLRSVPDGPAPQERPGHPPTPAGPGATTASATSGPPRADRAPTAPAPTSAPPYAARRSAPDPAPPIEPDVDDRRPDREAAVLPQRVPAEPDVPVVPEPPAVDPPAETPELARIATHLRREDEPAPLRERPEGFDVNAILDAVREVAGVRDAALRRTPAGAHSLRLDLSDGADPAEVSRMVARLLQERMGLAAAPQNLPGTMAAPTPPVRRRAASTTPEPRGAETRAGDTDPRQTPSREPEPAGRSWAGGREPEPAAPAGRSRSGGREPEPAAPAVRAVEPAGAGDPGPVVPQSPAGRPVAPGADPVSDPGAVAGVPRRRRPGAAGTHRGRASVEEATAGLAVPATGSPVTGGTSYSGGQMTTTETAPSRPLDTGGVPGPRVVIDHVQVSTFGLDATVEVRLLAGGETAAGHSTGPAVDGYVLRLCAVAAAAAVDELLRGAERTADRGRCFVEHAAVVPFGNCEVATVVALLVCDGWVEQLAGSALVAGDPRQAVVRATLAAVNRRLEALLA